MKLSTQSSSNGFTPEIKDVLDVYREVVFTHICALKATKAASKRLQEVEGMKNKGYATGKSVSMTLAYQEREASSMLWEATSRFLMNEVGWTKTDTLTDWTIV